jgi:hypothetical protein
MLIAYDQELHLASRHATSSKCKCPALEWSDAARSSRFMPGWYIVPSILPAVLLIMLFV